MTDGKATPQIAASLVNGLRRNLIEDGTWERVEADVLARAPMLERWLAETDRSEWVSLEGYLRFTQALLEVLGEDVLAARGASRLREDLDVGPLAPMLRGWIRGFATDTSELMRVAPHVWQAITRGAGRMVLVDSQKGRIAFAVRGGPPLLRELRGWHALIEGFAVELLRASGRQGSVSVGPDPDGASLALEAVWSED
jgi:hypothetical protein